MNTIVVEMVLNTEWAQVEVIDLINDGSGLAFGIIGGRSTGVVVKTILPGGVADRDGRLQSGDHILQIGEVNLRGLGSEQVASVLRQCGIHVRMVVARPVESTSADYQALGSHAPIVPTKILGDPVELDRHLIESGYAETTSNRQHPSTFSTPFIYTGQHSDIQLHPISGAVDVVKDPLPIGPIPMPPQTTTTHTNNMLPLDMALHEPNLPETETYTIELKKDDLGLGITVAGYVCEKEISGIFVKSISKGSAADLTSKIKINDRIIEVDGVSIVGFTNHQAVEKLRNTGSNVVIKFERYLRGPKYEQLQQAIRANEFRSSPLSSPTISTLPKVPLSSVQMSYLGIEPEGESRTSFDFDSAILLENQDENEDKEIVIDFRKSVQFSISSHESIYDKWKDRVDKDAQIVIAELHKDPNSGLGISLEGTVDVEDGKEVRPHHYIRNILPDGPVGRNGNLQAGDELLEVNCIQLLGLSHLEVVSILRQVPDFVSLVCARYPVPIRIIDTSQHPEAFQARKIFAGSLQTLIPNNERLVKAKSEASIASFASEACNGSRSRSLELITGLPMWSDEPTIVELIKGDYGLGFSILDYQDPLNPQETVIVIRSLVPGGVAQLDGRLIPGDRLIAVNDINVERASLDRAVQVLKGAQKGPVKITVAKPISSNDAISHTSQDTEDDQTCLEDFQECIEEYQECLDVVHICIDDDNSPFNRSASTSQIVELDLSYNRMNKPTIQALQVTNCDINLIGDSDLDISYKSTNDNLVNKTECDRNNVQLERIPSNKNLIKFDSLTQSDRVLTQSSNQDGYETCIDESLSDELPKRVEIYLNQNQIDDEITPTNSKVNIRIDRQSVDNILVTNSSSEPCLVFEQCQNRLCLDTKLDELKSYDDRSSDSLGCDEFFLVQYPQQEVIKSHSEPNVLDNYSIPITKKLTYHLKEYYNDYEDCLESYKVYSESKNVMLVREEMSDDLIFNEIILPFKSQSAPNIMENSFITLTYDPGPDLYRRRKSDFVPGQQNIDERSVDGGDPNPMKNCPEMLQKHWGSTHTIQVYREPNTSLGISIVGGKVDLHPPNTETTAVNVLGIFIKNVVTNSPAGRTGQFKTGDRILKVSGVDLQNASHGKAVEAIKNAPNPVTFVIQSLIPWNCENDHELERGAVQSPPPPTPPPIENHIGDEEIPEIKLNEPTDQKSPELSLSIPEIATPAPSPIIQEEIAPKSRRMADDSDEEDDDEDEDEDDVRELEGRTYSSKGVQIDRASAGNLRRTKEEIEADPEEEDDFGYTTNKVKKKYANLGHSVLMVQLERSNQGLGLSLAGHKDRNCMAVFVCGLNPNGAAYKTGGIQIGDEILEVNGVVLHGRCHLNASAIIKGLSGPIFKVIILRRKTAIDDIAVKPITQFPVSLEEEATEEQFSSNYPNVRTVTIKKGNQSLGIMIIEGKHAEVGQGIFISDIQEGSSAEKAGLEIGEMILAVNKDSLVGSNYETAANLLKRTEGLVTLVVSNPGKKNQNQSSPTTNETATTTSQQTSEKLSTLKPAGPPSRPTTPTPEPPADPATCPITPGKDVTIEIATENKGLGLFFVGGKDTLMPNGIVIIEVYQGGAAEKDNRLQPGDQILDVNGTLLKDVTNTTASQALRQTLPKMKMVVYRPEKLEFTPLDVELVKKPGKGLGLSVIARKSGKGVYIADVINGSTADIDGRIMKGDLLMSVNGQNLENSSGDEAGAILKTVTGRVSLKLNRFKPTSR